MKETDQLLTRLLMVKLPIIIENRAQFEMGINPEREEAYGYFNPFDISAIVQAHDDTLGIPPINLEGTLIHLKGGDSFYIPLHIEDVMKILCENKVP